MIRSEVATLFMSRAPGGWRPPLPSGEPVHERTGSEGRILVVEDEYFVGLTIENALVDAGYEVVEVVTTGEAAIASAVKLRPDLVLMDIRLAGEMNGIETALDLRRRGFPSIFASAHSDEATKQAGANAKPAGWLVKPFSDAELISAVRSALTSINSN